MRSGRLRERVTIQQRTMASDGMGGQTETWSTLATVWAGVLPRQANREALVIAANQLQARSGFDVRIRYRDDVSPSMRVSWRGNTLEVESVSDPDQRKREIVLSCISKEAQP